MYPGVAIHLLLLRQRRPMETLQVDPDERNSGDGVGCRIGNGDKKGQEAIECRCVCVCACVQK